MANKKYELHQSPFFKLRTKKKLYTLLDIEEENYDSLSSANFFRLKDNDGRALQVPIKELRKLHDQIQRYFSRLIVPEYLHSGVKKRSTITNAKMHQDCKYMITTDISSFFPNTSFKIIYRLFNNVFMCSKDVSYKVTKLICYNDILPTGSPLSQSIAFWAHKHIFDKINTLCNQSGIVFTLYVDDMTFSSVDKIPLSIIGSVKQLLAVDNLKIKNKKTKLYGTNDYKIVTGCIISPMNELKVHNKHKKKIIDLLRIDEENKNIRRIKGLISYCQSVEKRLFKNLKISLKNR